MCGERYAEEMRRYLAGQVEKRMDASEIPEDEKLRELIAQIELKVPVHNISFSTEFYPMERFHEIKALNLDLDYLS